MARPPGPLQSIELHTGGAAPFYALRFDAEGRTMGPETQQYLVDELSARTFTDVYLFSHGWNNDWDTALKSYLKFAKTVRDMITIRGLDFGRDYTPLLAGVFWPSAALVMPWEQGPQFAGDESEMEDIDRRLIADLAQSVPVEGLNDFYRLMEKSALDEREATELLGLVSKVFESGDPDLDNDQGHDARDVLVGWAKLEALLAGPKVPSSPGDFGRGRAGGAAATGPQAAGFLDKLNPRNLIRLLTVRQMKDRAGAVGANGVGPLVRDMLGATDDNTRYHLVGHSYGARVLLNAVARPDGQPLPRPVDSLLLLQPAVNHLCFASNLPGSRVGGYRKALDLVKRPIMSTFSVQDFPLRNTFHLALCRDKDIGEVEVAGDEPPNEYAALGGYGPRGTDDSREVAIKDPGDRYDFGEEAPRIWAVNGARTITGHSDIYIESTAWALFDLATAG